MDVDMPAMPCRISVANVTFPEGAAVYDLLWKPHTQRWQRR